ncbi:MAG: SPFH domain-containing protein [Bacteroidaceae bacterium]|nr:SPFH domain-containing protein [Bacteroidaceae bacterium]
MGLFGRGKSGGLMNVIRCDEREYLVWKWRPEDQDVNSTTRENSIRYGSSLRVKDGEVAVFVYKQKDGPMQDFIVGPFDQSIKTANFPVLASIVGLAYGGESPFQAEIYFINLAQVVQLNFTIPYFDVQDPRFPDLSIPVAAGGTITFKIEDYKGFIKVNRLINFTLEDFKKQIKDVVIKRVKGLLTNILYQLNQPLVQIERFIEVISDNLKDKLKTDLEDFGVVLRRLDISRIEPDKESANWLKLKKVTADYSVQTVSMTQDNALKTAQTQADLNIKNMEEMQAMNLENLQESLRIQREESQYAKHLQSQTANIGAYSAALQAEVLKTAASSLGEMGSVNLGSGDGNMNPAGMMTGMMMGGAMGQQMAGFMNNMGQQMNSSMQPQSTPPPMPQVSYMVAINGQQSGPYVMQQLQQLVAAGQLTQQTYVWRQGMANWDFAGNLPELAALFAVQQTAPQVPPVPGMPPLPQ